MSSGRGERMGHEYAGSRRYGRIHTASLGTGAAQPDLPIPHLQRVAVRKMCHGTSLDVAEGCQ